ncbi:MAG: hypothetical protein GX608_06970 [Lentisphaerae bacterium]|nr:hypothetical protein [Lentisphaerota bacterium]
MARAAALPEAGADAALVTGTDNTMASSTSSRRRRNPWPAMIAAGAVLAVGWYAMAPFYYEKILDGQRVDVCVFCDTAELRGEDLRAVVMYDKTALSPVARALGLFQNRPPDRVKTFHPVPAANIELTAVSATIKAVPLGPIARVQFKSGRRTFHALVRDRQPKNNTIYVRIE